jgi:hypothetical protein
MPVVVGASIALVALSRIHVSRMPLRLLLSLHLAFLGLILGTQGVTGQVGTFALTALMLDLLALVALAQPSLAAFCARQAELASKEGA